MIKQNQLNFFSQGRTLMLRNVYTPTSKPAIAPAKCAV